MIKKKFFLILAVLCSMIAGCGKGQAETPSARTEEKDRTAVTMMFSDDLPNFEALAESTYPDIDLQLELNAEATLDGESERRLHNSHGTDIVTSTMPTGDVKNYVMDLSAEPYVDRYQTAIFQNISDGGKTRFIPLPGQYYGYIYNAALLEQGNIPVPAAQMEIADMLDRAAAQGLGQGQDGTLFACSAAMSTISAWLMATEVPDFLSSAEGVIWTENILNGEPGFAEGMSHCLDLPRLLVERGYLDASTLSLSPQAGAVAARNSVPLEKRMLEGSLMMVYGSTRILTYLNEHSEKYRFSILPFMSSEGNTPWTITIPDAYLSINAELAQPGREAVLDACSRILDLLSTPEGQAAYLTDCGAAHSFLSSYDSQQKDIPDGLKQCVEDGYIYNIQIPARLLNYFGRQMIMVLNETAELEDALAAVDHYIRFGDEEADYDQSLVGLMAEDLIYENYNVRVKETALANLIADAVREQTGTQFAFVNGGSIRGSLYAGNVLGQDLDAVCPYGNVLVALEASGSVIRSMLANGISTINQPGTVPGGRFLNVSGLYYSFRLSRDDSPSQLLEVTLPDGSPLEDDTVYSITVTNYMAGANGYLDNNGDGYTMLNIYSDDVPKAEGVRLLEETSCTFSDALKNYFAGHNGEAITARCEGRIKVVTDDE